MQLLLGRRLKKQQTPWSTPRMLSRERLKKQQTRWSAPRMLSRASRMLSKRPGPKFCSKGRSYLGLPLWLQRFFLSAFVLRYFTSYLRYEYFLTEIPLVFWHADRKGIRQNRSHNIPARILAGHRLCTCYNTTTSANNHPLETSMSSRLESQSRKKLH